MIPFVIAASPQPLRVCTLHRRAMRDAPPAISFPGASGALLLGAAMTSSLSYVRLPVERASRIWCPDDTDENSAKMGGVWSLVYGPGWVFPRSMRRRTGSLHRTLTRIGVANRARTRRQQAAPPGQHHPEGCSSSRTASAFRRSSTRIVVA